MKKSVVLVEKDTLTKTLVNTVVSQAADQSDIDLKNFSSSNDILDSEYDEDVLLVLLDCGLSDWDGNTAELISLLREKMPNAKIKSYTDDICKYLSKDFDGDVKKNGNMEILKKEFDSL